MGFLSDLFKLAKPVLSAALLDEIRHELIKQKVPAEIVEVVVQVLAKKLHIQ